MFWIWYSFLGVNWRCPLFLCLFRVCVSCVLLLFRLDVLYCCSGSVRQKRREKEGVHLFFVCVFCARIYVLALQRLLRTLLLCVPDCALWCNFLYSTPRFSPPYSCTLDIQYRLSWDVNIHACCASGLEVCRLHFGVKVCLSIETHFWHRSVLSMTTTLWVMEAILHRVTTILRFTSSKKFVDDGGVMWVWCFSLCILVPSSLLYRSLCRTDANSKRMDFVDL